MSRYLFVVPPLVGHINPTLAVAEKLVQRGHEVAWAGHQDALGSLLVAGSQIYRASDDDLDAQLHRLRTTWQGLKGVAALKFLWQEFIVPVGHAMLPGVDRAIADFGPDVVISDQQAVAGPVAAMRAGRPWVTSATTSAELARSLQDLPKVEEWVIGLLGRFQRDSGIPDPVELRFSDRLVLCFTTTELIGPHLSFPDHFVFTGPAMTTRPPSPDFPWDRLATDRRRVLVSLGSLNAESGTRFFGVVSEALGDLVQVIMVAPEGMVDAPPPGSLVCGWVPQLDLLPHLDAVVSHAGHNTVVEALAHGLPQVVAPIRDDQPVVAQQIEAAGAAIRVRFARLRAPELRHAVSTVLDDPSYRCAAERIQRSFAAAGGAVTAADHLEALVA